MMRLAEFIATHAEGLPHAEALCRAAYCSVYVDEHDRVHRAFHDDSKLIFNYRDGTLTHGHLAPIAVAGQPQRYSLLQP
jgi:hypothetical protein